MKLHLSGPTGQNLFTGYGPGYVAVNGRRFTASVIVLPDRLVEDWPATTVEALAPGHLATLVDHAPEIVVLGTGARLRFPRAEILRPLVEARLGVEIMDVPAACRTYNILVAESRRVAAALVLEPAGP